MDFMPDQLFDGRPIRILTVVDCHTPVRQVTWFSDVRGRWQPLPHGVWGFRCRDGAGMNWSSTRGTLWFDGSDPELLGRIVLAAIQARIYGR
jgi:hypothetical protein